MLYDRNMSPGLFKTASVYTAISKDKLEQTTLIELTHNVSDVTNVTAATHNANQSCYATFKQSFEENLSYIQSYNLSSALPYMEILKLNPRPLTAIDQYNLSPPVFVTGCSTNHFKENMQLMENIDKVVRPAIPDLKIVVFDLGLKHAFEIEQVPLILYSIYTWETVKEHLGYCKDKRETKIVLHFKNVLSHFFK